METEDAAYQVLERAPTLSDQGDSENPEPDRYCGAPPGDKLPSSRELGMRFSVSRTVVREALRSLAAKGVLNVRSGSGATVAAVDAERASEALRLYVQGARSDVGGVTYEQIDGVREMLETPVARIAATEATDDDLRRLQGIHRRFKAVKSEPEEAAQLDVTFHREIAVSTHNPLYLLMLDSIEPVLLDIRRTTLAIPGRSGRASNAHQRILDKLLARDPGGAEQAMIEHLEESRGAFRDTVNAMRPVVD